MSDGGKGKGNLNSNDLGQFLDALAVEERDSRAPQGKSGLSFIDKPEKVNVIFSPSDSFGGSFGIPCFHR